MKVLVTGGAGFIGSHIVDLLVEQGVQVRVLDCIHPLAHSSQPDYLNPEAEYFFDDVRDPKAVASALDDVDAVCHQAAVVGLGVDFRDVTEYVSVNCGGTANLLKALWASRFQGRLVLASSMVVYGEGRYSCPEHGSVPADRDPGDLAAGLFEPRCSRCGAELMPEGIPEDAPPQPHSVYAATKLHQEHLVNAFAVSSGASVVSLRYHNVYGPRMPFDSPYAGVASIFRSALEQGMAPQVFEDGAQIRDFVHVKDVARANLIALRARPVVSGPFNVCSGDPRRLWDMASALWKACGSDASKPEITGRFRELDVRHVFASPDRASRELGFTAEISFEEGMRQFAGDLLRVASGHGQR
jgi:dTDP-L-rhamnose 4-epimerase